jgi:5-methylcytosine-specific restriction endonuclease McrA
VLRRDPLCKIKKLCGGFARSTEADHIKPIRAGGARFDLADGQGTCKPFHAWKTATEDSYFTRWKERGA